MITRFRNLICRLFHEPVRIVREIETFDRTNPVAAVARCQVQSGLHERVTRCELQCSCGRTYEDHTVRLIVTWPRR